MTRLNGKAVKRVARFAIRNSAPLDVVVTLYPSGQIGLRKKGRRTEYRTTLSAVWWLAVKAELEAK